MIKKYLHLSKEHGTMSKQFLSKTIILFIDKENISSEVKRT